MDPFRYPASPLARRHQPAGYSTYQSYRPWLRDEFLFRCVYCLKRETWGIIKGSFHLDHFHAQVHDPSGVLEYDNLLYACVSCNSAKGKEPVPNPCEALLRENVRVTDDGHIHGTSAPARSLIIKLGLDSADYREARRLIIGSVSLAAKYDPELFYAYMKFPDVLPDLTACDVPENHRPHGVLNSCHALRSRGELPDTYE